MNMDQKKYNLDDNELKLRQRSMITYVLLYAPLFGYTINREMFLFWFAAMVAGGISLAIKSRLMKPVIRTKVLLCELVVTAFLDLWILSNSNIPGIIKEVVFFAVLLSCMWFYFKWLYDGKLTEKNTVSKVSKEKYC